MIRQTVMPLKLERTERRVTVRSGLVLCGTFMGAMGVGSLIERHTPRPVFGAGL